MEKPALFALKKWSLIAVCAIYVILEIILAACAKQIAEAWIERYGKKLLPDEFEAEKRYIIIATIVTSIIAIILQLIGLIGIFFEHLCLTITFILLHIFGTIGSFVEALKTNTMYSEFAWSLVVSVIGVLFVRDLILIRRQIRHRIPTISES